MDQFLDPETDKKHQFLDPETDKKCQFLDGRPETDVMDQFLDPETDIMGEGNYIFCISTNTQYVQTREHAVLCLVVLTFLLCHSMRFLAKLYQIFIIDKYLSQER